MTTTNVLQDHQSLRQRAASVVLRLAELAEEEGGTITHQKRTLPRADFLREIADKLANNTFVLAVVGEFSRGKSSLINALLERTDLLPTSIEPSTAAITILSYAPEVAVAVTYTDGRKREGLTLADLSTLALGNSLDGCPLQEEIPPLTVGLETRAQLNGLSHTQVELALEPEPSSVVRTVNVGVPSSFLRDGICLVDTPGIGSVNPAHGDATREYIHNADAVLFLVNTDPVISQSECDFLAFLKDYVSRFLFLVTKIDRFSPRERQESVAYTRRTIEEHAGISRPPIFPISARLAQLGRSEPDEMKFKASGFREFLDGLQSFLVNARGREFLTRQVNLTLVQLDDLLNVTQVELQGLKMRLEDLPHNIEATTAALRQGEMRRRQILNSLDSRRRRIESVMDAFSPTALVRLELLLGTEVDRLIDGYDWDQLQRVSGTIPVFMRDMLASKLGPEFSNVARQLVSMRDDILAACRDYFGEMGARLRAGFTGLRLPERMTVSLDFDPNELSGRLQRIGTYTIGYTLALTVASMIAVGPFGALVMFGGLIARHTMTSALRNDIKVRLKSSLGPAVSRLLSDLFKNVREDVERTVSQFRSEVEEYLQSATASVEAKLSQLQEMRPVLPQESNERQHVLRVRLAELEQLYSELSLLLEPDW